MHSKIFLVTAVLIIFAWSPASATTLIDENFDDQAYSSPLSIYNHTSGGYDQDVVYQTGRTAGYALHLEYNDDGSAADGSELTLHVASMQNYLDDGIYFRYWIKYDTDFKFPGELPVFENLKLLKIAGTVDNSNGDVEFIFKDSSSGAGPASIDMWWKKESDGTTTGSGIDSGALFSGADTDYCGQQSLSKNCWHKVEIYIKIYDDGTADGGSAVHLTIDGVEVFEDLDADILLPTSDYIGTQQFYSIWAGDMPTDGYGDAWIDDVFVAYGEGDLTGGATPTPTPTPAPGSLMQPVRQTGGAGINRVSGGMTVQ